MTSEVHFSALHSDMESVVYHQHLTLKLLVVLFCVTFSPILCLEGIESL